eukprot:gene10985-biopygen9399
MKEEGRIKEEGRTKEEGEQKDLRMLQCRKKEEEGRMKEGCTPEGKFLATLLLSTLSPGRDSSWHLSPGMPLLLE